MFIVPSVYAQSCVYTNLMQIMLSHIGKSDMSKNPID